VITCGICGRVLFGVDPHHNHEPEHPKESPMPEPEKHTPVVGDEFEVVLRGKVTQVYRSGNFNLAHENTIDANAKHVISVTKAVLPLPTTPGSVVKIGLSLIAMRHSGGMWLTPTGNSWIDEEISANGWTLIYDAGAQ
jgi:hypothetical protein